MHVCMLCTMYTACMHVSPVQYSKEHVHCTCMCAVYMFLTLASCWGLSQTLFILISHWHHDSCTYNCVYSCTNVAKHINWFTIHYFIPPRADMILTALFAAIWIWQASPFNVLFYGAQPALAQSEQATSEEGLSELVTGRE